jgi:glycosyltransferase involved in cell wall biosynthesis
LNPLPVTPFASVLIPAYNAAATLEAALDSVNAQSFRGFEIVVVDDGSTDGTAEIAHRFAKQQPSLRVTVIQQPNGGQAAARNAAARVATGSWLSLLDADDIWYPDKLAAVAAEAAASPGAAIICHDMHAEDDQGNTRHLSCRPSLPVTYEHLLFASENSIFASGATVRADVFRRVGAFAEDRELQGVEDYDLWLRIAKCGEQICFIDRPLGLYRRGQTSGNVRQHAEHKLELLERHARAITGDEDRIDKWRRRRRAHIHYQAGKGLWRQRQRNQAVAFWIAAIREHPIEPSTFGQTASHAVRAVRNRLKQSIR